jgi:hypothetical protein
MLFPVVLSPDRAGRTIYLIPHRRVSPSRAATHPLSYFSRARGRAASNQRSKTARRPMTRAPPQRAALRRAGARIGAPKRSARAKQRSARAKQRSARASGQRAQANARTRGAPGTSSVRQACQRELHASTRSRATAPSRGDEKLHPGDTPSPGRAAAPSGQPGTPASAGQQRAAPSLRSLHSLGMHYCWAHYCWAHCSRNYSRGIPLGSPRPVLEAPARSRNPIDRKILRNCAAPRQAD